MFSGSHTLGLDYHAVLQRTRRCDTDGVQVGAVPELFATQAGANVIRYRLTMPELRGDAPALISLRYTTRISRGGITHISIVNGEVSDGAIWEVSPGDGDGTFTLSTIVRPPVNELIVYINLQGAQKGLFRIESLTAQRLQGQRPLRLAFVIDPWVERSEPRWKGDYIWWLGQMDGALRRAGVDVQTHYVLGDHIEPLWAQYRPHAEATYTSLPAQQLLKIYGSHRAGLIDQRRRLQEPGDAARRSAFIDLLRGAIPFEPDVIVAISDMKLLLDAFPQSLVLFRDALYCREPFPDELTSLDPFGLYRDSSLAKLVHDVRLSPEQARALDRFFPIDEEIKNLLAAHGLREGKFLLLPLQDSRHVNFYDESPFADQVDLVLTCLAQFPDRKILVTQHPDRREISPGAMAALLEKHPHLRYVGELESFSNPTARVLPLAGGVAGVSTGLLIQALLLGKPVHRLGRHALEECDLASSSADDRRRYGQALLVRAFASYRYLHDGRWLWTRLALLELWKRGAVGAEALAIDLPGNVVRSLETHARSSAPSRSPATLAQQGAASPCG